MQKLTLPRFIMYETGIFAFPRDKTLLNKIIYR